MPSAPSAIWSSADRVGIEPARRCPKSSSTADGLVARSTEAPLGQSYLSRSGSSQKRSTLHARLTGGDASARPRRETRRSSSQDPGSKEGRCIERWKSSPLNAPPSSGGGGHEGRLPRSASLQAFTTNLYFLEAASAGTAVSSTCTVALKVPASVGVPASSPAAERLTPGGKPVAV